MKTHNPAPVWLGAALAAAMLLVAAPASAGSGDKAKKPDPMQVVRGAKAWKNNCGRCHNLRSPQELTDEEWDVSVSHMRVRANLTGFDARDIKAFLKASNNQ